MESKDMVKKEKGSMELAGKLPIGAPLVDIFENDDEILLHAELPGVEKSDIKINIDNGQLTLSGIRLIHKDGAVGWQEFGDLEFRRSFSVPQSIDVNKVNAELKDGILNLHLPKAEAAKPRVIEIKTN